MMRKTFSIAGAVAGVAYAALGMAASYKNPAVSADAGRIAIEFLVISIFTAPLGGAIGLGFGLLLDGIVQRK